MGHMVGKDVFRELGRKIDGMEMRAPWNERLHALLKELYSGEEADVVIKMPYGLTGIDELTKVTGYQKEEMQRVLDQLAEKGLVMDFWVHDEYKYGPSPFVIGIFEFTMMRLGPNTNSKEWARLFRDYMEGDASFFSANFGGGEQISFQRTLPYEETVKAEEYVEILDYEKASALLEASEKFSIGLCSCRHERMHLNEKNCEAPLESCSQFGYAADFMIRHNLGREVSRDEMRDNFARSRDLGLVMTADNVRKNVKFVCHCCACCCNILRAINETGYANILVTSNFLADVSSDSCCGCGKCAKACPIKAISMVTRGPHEEEKVKESCIDKSICLGCGVCALQCPTKSCKLIQREQRVIHPETTFERVILQCLEKGTLQNQIFTNPQRIDQRFMRAFVGGFLRLSPVKKALLNEILRSKFLKAMGYGLEMEGRGWLKNM